MITYSRNQPLVATNVNYMPIKRARLKPDGIVIRKSGWGWKKIYIFFTGHPPHTCTTGSTHWHMSGLLRNAHMISTHAAKEQNFES